MGYPLSFLPEGVQYNKQTNVHLCTLDSAAPWPTLILTEFDTKGTQELNNIAETLAEVANSYFHISVWLQR